MSDTISKEKRTEVMKKIKSTNTKLEVLFCKALSKAGFKYRKNVLKMQGKPDVVFAKDRLVIFVDSCFWHGCRHHLRVPATNTEYWDNKITRNKLRDIYVNKYYKDQGWTVVRVWEHTIKNDIDKALLNIKAKLASYA